MCLFLASCVAQGQIDLFSLFCSVQQASIQMRVYLPRSVINGLLKTGRQKSSERNDCAAMVLIRHLCRGMHWCSWSTGAVGALAQLEHWRSCSTGAIVADVLSDQRKEISVLGRYQGKLLGPRLWDHSALALQWDYPALALQRQCRMMVYV